MSVLLKRVKHQRRGNRHKSSRNAKDQLVNPDEPKKKEGMSPEDNAKMEQEMESLERDLKAIGENYTENMFNLTCARNYIKKLLENAKVVRFLNANHSGNPFRV
jgi:hypothetical protein